MKTSKDLHNTQKHGKRALSGFAILLVAFLSFVATDSIAGYTINPFTNGNFCTSTYPSAYQAGSFSISETNYRNFSGFTKGQTSRTLVIGLSGGSFQFNPGVGTVTVSGTGVTIVSYAIAASTITVTITTASTNTLINTISFNNIEIRANAAGVGKIIRSGGNFYVDNRTTRPKNTTSWGALATSAPMTYTSGTTTQTVSSAVFSGSVNNQILGLQIVVAGACGSLSITQFNLNTTGSTNAVADILNAKIYYTNTTSSFSTTTLFGTKAGPSGAFSITGVANLTTAGTYYFWLVYDITPIGTSVNNDLLDAQFVSVIAGAATKIPTVTSPAGTRTISNNIYYSIANGNWNNTAIWSKSSGGTTCGCYPSLGNGWVFVNHAVSLNLSSTVDIVTVQAAGALTNTSGSALTTVVSLNTTGNGIFTIAITPWSLNDVTLAGTGISKSSVSQTINGDLNIGATNTFQMTAASATTLTVMDDIDIDGTLALTANNLTASNATGSFVSGTGSVTGTGTITLGVSKIITIGSNLSVAAIISVSAGATITNQATVNMTNNIQGSGTWLNDVGANLNMGGTTSTITVSTLAATATGNSISYNGSGAQTVKGNTYENLVTSGSGTKTLGAATTINNSLTINGAAQLSTGASTLNVDNQWTNNSINAAPFLSASTVFFTGNCIISGSGVNTFNHLYISATGDLLSHPTNGLMVVQGNWTNDGDFDSNDSDITFAGTSTISGTSTTLFNDIIVNTSKSLTISSTPGEVDLEGDLTVNGSLSTGTSLVMFAGGGWTQNIKGTVASFTFYQFEIDNIGGTVQLQRPVIITNKLALTNGWINTASVNSLTLNNAVTMTGGSVDSFVNGPLIHQAISNSIVKIFPIGKGADYRPVNLVITATGTPTSNYTAELFNGSTTSLGYTLPAGIDRASGIHYWVISQSNAIGFTNAKAQLSYDVNDQVSDPSHLVVLKNVGAGTSWFNMGGAGSAATTGTIMSNTFTSFGTFSFGNNGGVNSLPVELLKFEAFVNSGKVELRWTTESEVSNDYFTVEKTQDIVEFEQVAVIKGAGTTQTNHSYRATDSLPYAGVSYYRLKQTDLNGKATFSGVVRVSVADKGATLYPNPVTGNELNLRIMGNANDVVRVSIVDVTGNVFFIETFTLTEDATLFTISNLERFAKGLYIVNTAVGLQLNYYRVMIQ